MRGLSRQDETGERLPAGQEDQKARGSISRACPVHHALLASRVSAPVYTCVCDGVVLCTAPAALCTIQHVRAALQHTPHMCQPDSVPRRDRVLIKRALPQESGAKTTFSRYAHEIFL